MDFDLKKDYYAVLGISETATDDEIKKVFRKLAMQYHPDRGGDAEKFKEINEAYQLLSDPQKRQQYDAMRKGGFDFGNGFGGFGGFSGGTVDLGDFLGDIFGNVFGGQQRRRGEDITVSLTLTLAESYSGVTKTIKYKRNAPCKKCSGTGVPPDASQQTCKTCKGRGQVMQSFGMIQMQSTCPECKGKGFTYSKKCPDCTNGSVQTMQELEIKVPAGISEKDVLKYTAMGHYNGSPGDLYLKITVTYDKGFSRRGDDLLYEVELPIVDLVLGTTITIPHPTGSVEAKIPKGTQVREIIKISGKGFNKQHLLIIPIVSIPKKLSPKEQKLWEELKSITGK